MRPSVSAVVAGIFFAPICCAAVGTYSITNLADVSGNSVITDAAGINSRGQVVGRVQGGIMSRGYLWSPSTPNSSIGAWVDIGGLPGGADYSWASGINDIGQVVGLSSGESGNRAFLWTPAISNGATGTMVSLGALAGGIGFSSGVAVNSHGQVIGDSSNENGRSGFLWTPSVPNGSTGTMLDFGNMPGESEHKLPWGLNSVGQVVGTIHPVVDGMHSIHPFLWTPTAPNTPVGTLLQLDAQTPVEPIHLEIAAAISSSGKIVGRGRVHLTGYDGGYWYDYYADHAVLWSPTTTNGSLGLLVDLGTLGHASYGSFAKAINSHGTIVGSSELGAFVWTPSTLNGMGGTMFSLKQLITASDQAHWALTEAIGINDLGQIIGNGYYDVDGPGGAPAVQRGFLLTPIPEPTVMAQITVVVLFAIARRRSRRNGLGSTPTCHRADWRYWRST